jgi:hypothetical protein
MDVGRFVFVGLPKALPSGEGGSTAQPKLVQVH